MRQLVALIFRVCAREIDVSPDTHRRYAIDAYTRGGRMAHEDALHLEPSADSGARRAARGHLGETLVRMLRVLAMLPRPPHRIHARVIHRRLREEGHIVTTRTIERDLHRLRCVIRLELDDAHKPYGWSWDRKVGGELE